MKFAFIHRELAAYPVEASCRALQVSRSGYYRWRQEPHPPRQQRQEQLVGKILAVHQANRRVYGSPRVHRALLAAGEQVCENTVAKLMRERGIRAKVKRKFVPCTTDSRHDQPVAPNRLDRQFHAPKPNQKWAVDITYVRTEEGWLYLAGVIDLCSRRIVGHAMAEHMRQELAGEALEMALLHRQPGSGLLHHSDRGVQYACEDYQKRLKDHGVQVSMSGKGECWDNAVMESFWGTLKTELVYQEHYATREEAKRSIFEYIEVFYNRQRLHSALGYQSPEAFEASLN